MRHVRSTLISSEIRLYFAYRWRPTKNNLLKSICIGITYIAQLSLEFDPIDNTTIQWCYREAAQYGRTRITLALLNIREMPDFSGPIHYALNGGHTETALVILNHPACKEVFPGWNLLTMSARLGYVHIFRKVIQKTQYDAKGALEVACIKGHLDIVLEIINVYQKRKPELELDLDSALRLAADHGNILIMKALLTAGATTAKITSKQLRIIKFQYKNTDVAKLIEQNGKVLVTRRQRARARGLAAKTPLTPLTPLNNPPK